jgi:hypothetical protein
MKEEVTLRNGRKMLMRPALASLLRSRMMVAAESYETTVIAPATAAKDDGLDALDAEQLHALAKERGVVVHHRAGADKVRAALREG